MVSAGEVAPDFELRSHTGAHVKLSCSKGCPIKAQTLALAKHRVCKGKGKKRERAKEVGKLLAKKCQDAKVSAVVFDRNGFNYHGRVAGPDVRPRGQGPITPALAHGEGRPAPRRADGGQDHQGGPPGGVGPRRRGWDEAG